MKLDALDHPKTLDFAARLGVTRPTAIGHLELFWHFVAKYAPQGNVGKQPDGAIARGSEWQGDAQIFVNALIESRLVDVCEEHRLLVHDWHEHCPNWLRGTLGKAGKPFFTTKGATKGGTNEAPLVRPSRARVPPGEGKGSQGRPGEAIPGEGKGHAGSVDDSGGSEPEPEDFAGQNSPPSEPSKNGNGERRNGDFEAINAGVVKLVTEGGYVTADTRGLARALHCSVRQVEVAIEQLRDRGQLPGRAA